ncbi:transaldolase [Myxosarcina sp. GI1]|uniref:transaldolase n=1 Tax=Myxosarcina sp. GI1 TaxID=1541065 RepID=UPI0005693113|nr:transaldolase [Myxosarcina sp. GI1]
MTNNPLLEIDNYGQSIWMDNLNRSLIESGELKQMIEDYGIRGITSNPSIFEKAIAGNQIYDADIEAGVKAGKSVSEIYESLIFDDIRHTCDLFRPIYEQTGGLDGYVSIEVSPRLARDTPGTVEEALRFYRAIDRDNVMIKIPGTPEGFPAVERVISQGINVNVTLLFSVESYENAAWAYIRGLEDRVAKNQPIDKIASVASFFLSRIDTKIDDRIDERLKNIGTENLGEESRLQQIQGKVAIANAKVAYQKQQEILKSDRWQALKEKGANLQRLLWASTSTKNPKYSDVMYVNELVAPNTVNTMPPDTMQACADHCDPAANRIEINVEESYRLLESLKDPDVEIDLDEVMYELLEEGIDKFIKPFDSLQQTLESKVKQLSPV